MRLFGIVFVCACSFLVGIIKANIFKSKVKLVDDFICALKSLKLEIEYSANNLNTSAINIAKKNANLNKFWMNFANCLESGENSQKAWLCAKKTLLNLDARVEAVLSIFFDNLGKSDISSQCNFIDVTIISLQELRIELELESKSKGKVASALGTGVALILFIALI